LAAVTGRRARATTEHRRILAAIRDGSAEEASQAMRQHLLGVHAAVAEL